MSPIAPAGWPTIEFSDRIVVRFDPSTWRWSRVVCIGLDPPWIV